MALGLNPLEWHTEWQKSCLYFVPPSPSPLAHSVNTEQGEQFVYNTFE